MTFRRLIIFSFASIAVALLASITTSLPAHGVDPKAYWDGPSRIKVQHPFFTQDREEGEDIKTMDNSVTFVLDRSSRYPFRFVTEGMQVTTKEGNDSCTFTSFSLTLKADADGTFTAETPFNYSSGNSIISGIAVEEASLDAGIGRSVWGANGCETSFAGELRPLLLPSGLNSTIKERADGLNEPFPIRGEMGAIAELTAFREQLDVSKNNETTRYTHRMCGTDKSIIPNSYLNAPPAAALPALPSPAYIACVDNAKNAYDVIWQYCERYAVGLYNQYERVDSFKACIEDRSGLDIHASSLDSTLLNTIDYKGGESCSIRYIGWIICPLSRFMASVTDAAFDGLSQFFVIRPLGREEQAGAALYRAWSLVNTFANVIFIIAFLVVIFSQVTGRGMSNLGIKRLLPKIILTAILVNASYYICIVAVDLSNILGIALKDVIKAVEPQQFRAPSTWTQEVENLLVFGAAAAGGAFIILTASIVAMLPLLVGALLSLVVAVIMLVARYALILILIILAPVAIACTLLPNTQKWYNQWFKLFTSMLMLFPLIAIVFGGSQVAGILVLNSSLSRSTGDITLQLFGLAIMALPLAITPLLVRLGGGILNRFGGIVSSRGFFKNTKARTEKFVERHNNARDVKALTHTGDKKRRGLAGMRDGVRRREYLRKAQHSFNDSELKNSQAEYNAAYQAGEYGGDKIGWNERHKSWQDKNYKPLTRGQEFAKDQSKGGLSAASAAALELDSRVKINTDQVKAAKVSPEIQAALARDTEGNMSAMTSIATNDAASPAIRQAAIELVMEQGTGGDINTVVKSVSSMNKDQRRAVAVGVTSGNSVRQSPYYDHPDVQRTIMTASSENPFNLHEEVIAPWLNSKEFSETGVGTMHHSSLGEVRTTLAGTSVDASVRSEIPRLARSARADSSIQKDGAGNNDKRLEQLDHLANGR